MNVITAMAENGNHAENSIWPSLETASKIFDLSSFGLIAGLVLGAVATVLIVWMGIVKEHHWDVLRERSNEKVASLELEAAKANTETARLSVEAEQARAEIAGANERAASAQQKAAQAVLELAKIKTPRTLTEEQRSGLVRNLAPLAGQKYSLNVFGDAESINLMRSLDAALQSAGWVRIPPQIGVMTIHNAGDASDVGLSAAIKRSSSEGTIQNMGIAIKALALAGLSFTGMYVADLKVLDAINFNVGQKPVD